VIVPDLPPDYDEGLFAGAARLGLAAVPVLSPSMTEARLARVASLCPEFIYATLRTGTTGPRTAIDAGGVAFLSRIASLSPGRTVKILGGFGVSTREQVVALTPLVHAVVVGSAFVREVAKGGDVRASMREKLDKLLGRV
jgi:tryptophan synthase alpha chain